MEAASISARGENAPPPRAVARDAFAQWCRDRLFTADTARALALTERACDLYLLRVYRELRMASWLSESRSAEELRQVLGLVDTAEIALEAALWRLAARTGVVEVVGEDPPRFLARADPPDPAPELATLRSDLASGNPAYLAGLDWLEYGAQHFVTALRDDPELLDRVLSGREASTATLWDRATNLDPLQDVHGRMGARAVASVSPGGTILEIGGGTGNGIRHLLAELGASGRRSVERYIFTDISTAFVLGTRRVIRREFPDVPTEWHYLDINRPFVEQNVAGASVDLIYGVNAAHVAIDIVAFLRECLAALRPGGHVIFAERVRQHPRDMAPRELTLNLSIYHRTAARRDPVFRPAHCYLTPECWMRALSAAGFTACEIWPNLREMTGEAALPYAVVVIATKPGHRHEVVPH